MSEIISITYRGEAIESQQPVFTTETSEPQPVQPRETREADITDPIMIAILAGGVAMIGAFMKLESNGRKNERAWRESQKASRQQPKS